jgi:hypothetical protein
MKNAPESYKKAQVDPSEDFVMEDAQKVAKD